MIRAVWLVLVIVVLVACQPKADSPEAPAMAVFPTTTPGQVIRGVLDTPSPFGGTPFANPATAVALANQPTATPDTSICPSIQTGLEPDDLPNNIDDTADAIIAFLSDGGTAAALRDTWEIFVLARNDIDLTGDLTPEVIFSFVLPETSGMLLIAGCEEGRYVSRYQAVADEAEAPEIILLGDINVSQLNNVVFVSRNCVDGDDCRFQTQIITWQPDLGRFVSLLGDTILSDDIPEIVDIDDDQVGEVLVRLESLGTAATGPLRTGADIYDWNGEAYMLSIVRRDPPRYRIQILHEADRYFDTLDMATAIDLYQTTLTDEDLRAWITGEELTLEAYALYRLLVAQAYLGDTETATAVIDRIENKFAEIEQPVYVSLSRAFWTAYEATGDAGPACSAVLDMVEEQPSALNLLNRYGRRSPTYTAQELCPF